MTFQRASAAITLAITAMSVMVVVAWATTQVPAIAVAGDRLASDNTIVLNVSFSEGVSGMAAEDFLVASPDAVIVTRRQITGHGKEWQLLVELEHRSEQRCPTGFTLSPSGTLCGMASAFESSWSTHAAWCEPFTLASVFSAGDLGFFAGLRETLFSPYWYVLFLGALP